MSVRSTWAEREHWDKRLPPTAEQIRPDSMNSGLTCQKLSGITNCTESILCLYLAKDLSSMCTEIQLKKTAWTLGCLPLRWFLHWDTPPPIFNHRRSPLATTNILVSSISTRQSVSPCLINCLVSKFYSMSLQVCVSTPTCRHISVKLWPLLESSYDYQSISVWLSVPVSLHTYLLLCLFNQTPLSTRSSRQFT